MKTVPFKKFLSAIFIIFVLFCLSTPVLAAGESVIDWTKTGSVSVTLKDGDAAVSGAEITLYKVADAGNRNSNLHFTFTDAFADFGGTPEKLQDAAAIWRLADYTAEQNVNGQTLRTDGNGFLCFENLSLGLYLAVQSGSVQGYSDCSPFLVSLPTESDNEWMYDIDATPKTDVVRLIDITVQKAWNDNGKDRPESVTVQLLRNDTVIDTVSLNEQNGWCYTWADQPKSDMYSVKEINIPKGYTATYQQNGFTFTVTNTSTLIQTGQLKWPIPVLAGAGLLLFAGGWILYSKGKRKYNA